jgi:hypothetical protein
MAFQPQLNMLPWVGDAPLITFISYSTQACSSFFHPEDKLNMHPNKGMRTT